MNGARCPENERLRNLFGEAVAELLLFHEQHFIALMKEEADFERYELLIHLASEKRQAAKYALLVHIESHGCEVPAESAVLEFAMARESRGARLERRKQVDPDSKLQRRSTDL